MPTLRQTARRNDNQDKTTYIKPTNVSPVLKVSPRKNKITQSPSNAIKKGKKNKIKIITKSYSNLTTISFLTNQFNLGI